MNKKILQIGAGKMGSIWAKSFNEYGELIGIVDKNESKADYLANKYNTTKYMDINNINKKSDIWCIATPTEYHHKYIIEAIERNIDTVLVEKPATIHPEINQKIIELNTNTTINVDYIELENIIYKYILKDINNTHFNLSEAIHWRGKNIPQNLFPFMRNELVHDISEIVGLFNQQNINSSDISVKNVSNIRTWNEETYQYNSNYDIQAIVELKGPNNERICLKGGFNQQYNRRYFLWIDNEKQIAYLGSTISRKNLTPIAIRIHGEKNIQFAKEKCMSGLIRNDIEFNELITNTNAKILKTSNKLTSDIIANKIVHGEISPINLSDSTIIEKIMYNIYQQNKVPNIY